MKDYKDPLKKLLTKSKWKIIAFTIIVNTLYSLHRAIDFYFYLNANFPRFYRRFVHRNPAKRNVHFINPPRRHPDRLAFLSLTCLVLVGMTQLPSHHHVLYWSIGWGSAFVGFTLYLSIRIIYRKLSANRIK